MATNNVKNYFQQPGGGKDNILQLVSSKWAIDGTLVTATAAALNNAAALTPLNGTHTTSWGTAFSPAISGNIAYQKVGTLVTLLIPNVDGTTVGTVEDIVSTVALPLALRPTAARNCLLLVNDGTDVVIAKAVVATTGIITIGGDLIGTGFAATTAISIIASSITYIV